MLPEWAKDAFFYHIYPLGFCGAPQNNDHQSLPQSRLEKIYTWIEHLRGLGVNTLYLGPLFESSRHGYDTADYYHVDRRLGTIETLAGLIRELHSYGIRVVLDGVFNHVGRDFWAFRDVLQNGQSSRFCSWFEGLKFDGRSPFGDPFTYQSWNGHFELVKLNLRHPETRLHLLGAVRSWIEELGIDGLRLDTADCLDLDFQKELSVFTSSLRSDFLLLGEVIHGDYRRWVNPEILHSVTNYECYKGLYSSLVDKNYFEIAYAINRQFGAGGIYRDFPLYNFTDNHDVDRVASKLSQLANLYPLYALLFSMPGIPSIYYGSEWGITGSRTKNSDQALRPNLDLDSLRSKSDHPDLPGVIRRLARIRHNSAALRRGDYQQLMVTHQQFSFARQLQSETVIVQINAAQEAAHLDIPISSLNCNNLVDVLNNNETVEIKNGHLVNNVPSNWARILIAQN